MDVQTARHVDSEIVKLILEAEKAGDERRAALLKDGNAHGHWVQSTRFAALLMAVAVGTTVLVVKLLV